MKILFILLSLFCFANLSMAQDEIIGDWKGEYLSDYGDSGTITAEILAQKDDHYLASIRIDYGSKLELAGKKTSAGVVFAGEIYVGEDLGGSYQIDARIVDGVFTGKFSGIQATGTINMKKVVKKSPTLSMKPPENAIVLFDGANLNAWRQKNGEAATWKITPDGAMEVTKHDIVTRKKFSDFKLHLEFKTPLKPEATGQARGNSGVYLLERYELQILDSYGLTPQNNDCGAIYKVAAPLRNACYPPLQWQTYDITFHAPRFDQSGKKIKNALVTVEQNGILIQDETEIPHPTGSRFSRKEMKEGGILLQDHHNPVQFKNIWILPL